MRLLRRAPVPVDDLVARAAQGDRVALAVLRADLPARTVAALRRLVASPDGSALGVVAAARSVAQDGAALRPLVDLLLDGDVRSPAVVAELLDVPERAVLEALGRRAACRAWGLIGGEGLTDAERQAGQAHAAVCRPCASVLDVEDLPARGAAPR